MARGTIVPLFYIGDEKITVVVGYTNGKNVWIGADSLTSDGDVVMSTKMKKVFRVGDFLIGAAGSVRMSQVLRYQLDVPAQTSGVSSERFMVNTFIDCVRDCFRDAGLLRTDEGEESSVGSFLVGYKGEIYEICSDYQVNHYEENVATIGAGRNYALGAMLALDGLPPAERIRKSLEVSGHLSVWVREPYYVKRV